MPQWINAKYRTPVIFGRYFVKVDGYKDLLTVQEIEIKRDRDHEVLWLDDSDSAPAKTVQYKKQVGRPKKTDIRFK